MKICRELCDKTGGTPQLALSIAYIIMHNTSHLGGFFFLLLSHRHVRRRYERRTLQRPHFRAYTSTACATRLRNRSRSRRGSEDERRLDDDGFPATTTRHGTSRSLRMSRADACGGISLSALWRAALRCADRLRRLWSDDRIVASSRTELSSFVSRQALLGRVSSPPNFAVKLSDIHPVFFSFFLFFWQDVRS